MWSIDALARPTRVGYVRDGGSSAGQQATVGIGAVLGEPRPVGDLAKLASIRFAPAGDDRQHDRRPVHWSGPRTREVYPADTEVPA